MRTERLLALTLEVVESLVKATIDTARLANAKSNDASSAPTIQRFETNIQATIPPRPPEVAVSVVIVIGNLDLRGQPTDGTSAQFRGTCFGPLVAVKTTASCVLIAKQRFRVEHEMALRDPTLATTLGTETFAHISPL